MRLKAGCEIALSSKAPAPFVAMLRPRSGRAQWVSRELFELTPRVPGAEYVDVFGNLCQRLIAPPPRLVIKTEMVVDVDDSIATKPGAPLTLPQDLPDQSLQFLLPSRYCPSDSMNELAQTVVRDKTPGYDQVDAIRGWIRDTIEYRYGVSKPTSTALDTIRDKAGVCRDFSHIGISLCRALRIPARIVVGYLHGLEPMDLHAWFEAFVDGRWYAFDATQPAPLGGRIAIAFGRDAADVALITELGELKTDHLKVWVDQV